MFFGIYNSSFWGAERLQNQNKRELNMQKRGFVYIMANDRPTLYTGVTSNIVKRAYEHKHNLVSGFTAKYLLHKLIYYEELNTIGEAIIREKQIKDMNRESKLEMIKRFNPILSDLYEQIIG